MIGSHRVLVASLFLPAGIEFDAAPPSSPALSGHGAEHHPEVIGEDEELVLPSSEAPVARAGLDGGRPSLERALTDRGALAGGGGQTPGLHGVPPTKGLSIIDDLQAHVNKSPAATPRHEPATNPFFPSAPGANGGQAQANGGGGVAGAITNVATAAARALNLPPPMTRGKSTRGIPSEMSLPSSPASGHSGATSPRQRPTVETAASKHANPIVDRSAGKGMGAGGQHPLSASSAVAAAASDVEEPGSPVLGTSTPRRLSGTSPVIPGSPSFATGPSAATATGSLGRSASSRSSSRRRSTSQQTFSQAQREALKTVNQFHLANNPQGNIGLQNALNAIEEETKGIVWVGALGDRTDNFDDSLRAEIDDRLWKGVGPARPDAVERRARAVWVEDKVFEGSYDVFCKQILWPTFHYSTVRKDETTNWDDYVKVNQAFADRLVETYEEGDIIFVNDYHLLLVPQMVRSKLPKAIIGFFLHIAFPSSEIFRCLALREELLQGMLGANLIGFQTYNFSRHFRQTVSRVLQSVEATPKGIQMGENFVDVEVFGIGIDVESLDYRRSAPEVDEWANSLRERYGDTKLIVARDKLDEVKGLKHKLLSFERFLQMFPAWRGKVVLIQVALATTETNEAQENISDLVTRINSRFSSLTYQPVVLLHTEPPTFSQYLGLMTAADAFINTSLREGMNLTSHEFIRCQEGKHGAMILSEFTGSYSHSSFQSCLPVNPYDYTQVARAINQGLEMSPAELTTRWKDLNAHVVDHTAQAWAKKFLAHCERAHAGQLSRTPGDIPHLQLDSFQKDFLAGQKRLLLVDFEGLLWNIDPRVTHAEGFTPPADLIELLNDLTKDAATTVYLLSGWGKPDLDKIASQVPRLGLVAEHGCWIKPAGGNDERAWQNTVRDFDMSWRAPAHDLLYYFSERTPGSYVEDRGSSIVWRFSNAGARELAGEETPDHAWAKRQAAEAQNHVSDVLCERYKLQIYPGRDAFLLCPRHVTRSAAVAAILPAEQSFDSLPAHLSPSIEPAYDFIATLTTDQKLITALNALKSKASIHTITAGNRHSTARWVCDREEAGKVAVTLRNLVDSASK